MSKQQDTEDQHSFALILLNKLGFEDSNKLKVLIDQQKAEAADQAVREFAAELIHYINYSSAVAVTRETINEKLEQFIGKGKDK